MKQITKYPHRLISKVTTLILCFTAILISGVAAANTFNYVAVTLKFSHRQGTVIASGIHWLCRANRCTVSGPWPTPGVSACNALARVVGPIKSYGHQTVKLNASQLRQCNSGVAYKSSATGYSVKPVRPRLTPSKQIPTIKQSRKTGKAVTQWAVKPSNVMSMPRGRAQQMPSTTDNIFGQSPSSIPGGGSASAGQTGFGGAPPPGAADDIRAAATRLRNRPIIDSYYDADRGGSTCVSQRFTIRGRNFGGTSDGRYVFLLDPRNYAQIRRLQVLSWTNDNIIVSAPEQLYGQPGRIYSVGILDHNREIISNTTRYLHICPSKFTVSGNINVVNCNATASTLRVDVIHDGQTQSATVSPNPENPRSFTYKASIAAAISRNIEIHPRLYGVSCPGGNWSPDSAHHSLSYTHTGVTQPFTYRVDMKTAHISKNDLLPLFEGIFNLIKVHINNYDPATHSLKTGDTFIQMPSILGGQRRTENIPPLVNGPRKYYINDVNMKNAKLGFVGSEMQVHIEFEDNGTEFIGTCGEDGFDAGCIAGAPDVDAKLTVDIYFTLDRYSSDTVPNSISFSRIRVIGRDNAQADGFCKAIDFLCSAFNDYHVLIRRSLQSAVYSALDNKDTRDDFGQAMIPVLNGHSIDGPVQSISIGASDIIVKYLPGN